MAQTIHALSEMSEDTLAQIRGLIAQSHDNPHDHNSFARDITTTLGLVNYDLQRPSKMIIPEITPLLNMTPRVAGEGGLSTNWKMVTGLNTTGLEGVAVEGGRGARTQTTTADKSSFYKTIGLEDSVTFEAESSAQGFEDIRASTAMHLIMQAKIAQERMLLGGNTGLALGTPTAPTSAAAHDAVTPGNFVHAVTYNVIVVALTMTGYRNSSLANGVPGLVTLNTPDGDTITYGGGSSAPSAVGAILTGAGADDYVVSATCPPVSGAVAYAWFVGVPGGERLAAITNINSVRVTTIPLTPRQLASTLVGDHSANLLAYDGLITWAQRYGVVVVQATGTAGTGTTLTSNNAGGIVEIDRLLRTQWDTNRTSPSMLVMNSQEVANIYTKVIAGSGAPMFRFNLDGGSPGDIIGGGRVVGSFLNKFTPDGGQLVRVILHPDMPPGTIMALTDRIPGEYFHGTNLGNLWEMKTRRDYYQLEWPLRSRRYETGVYAEEVLVHYFPASMALLTNIADG